MIHWFPRREAAFSPIEVDVPVGASQSWRTFQFLVAEILSFQPTLSTSRNNEVRTLKYLIQVRDICRI